MCRVYCQKDNVCNNDIYISIADFSSLQKKPKKNSDKKAKQQEKKLPPLRHSQSLASLQPSNLLTNEYFIEETPRLQDALEIQRSQYIRQCKEAAEGKISEAQIEELIKH